MILFNGKIIEFGKFPNGEINLPKEQFLLQFKTQNVITLDFKYEGDGDLIKLMMVKNFLDQETFNKLDIKLNIRYMPYSRMDRANNDYAFSLKYICEFINTLKFSSVTVTEPHSDVCIALLDRCKGYCPTVNQAKLAMKENNFDKDKDYIYFPDAGAQKRYASQFADYKQIVGFKTRDFKTGMITDLKVLGDMDSQDFKVMMIDDLCSGGFTFKLSADTLRELGAKEVYLCVAHIEDTIQRGFLLQEDSPVDKIYTTDSILNIIDDRIQLY